MNKRRRTEIVLRYIHRAVGEQSEKFSFRHVLRVSGKYIWPVFQYAAHVFFEMPATDTIMSQIRR